MINLPTSTMVNRFIPKEKFYAKTNINTKLRQLFTDEIEKITWSNKISPETLNITASEYIELQVFQIILKGADVSLSLLKHIDTFIPYPILFILKRSDATKAVISFKEPTTSKNILMKVNSYYDTGWKQHIQLELKGRSVDEIYKNYLHQIAPKLDLEKKHDVKSAVEDNLSKEKLLLQINAINRSVLNEPSVAKQQELARERYLLEQQLEIRYT